MVTASPVVSLFSCMGLCAQIVWTYPEFQFMTTAFMSMAARLNDLDDLKPEIKIQTDSHTLTPTSGQNGPEDQEAFGSTPSHTPSQSLARKPTPDQPESLFWFRNTGNLHWGWQSDTTTTLHMAGANCGRHGLGRQSWPNRSCIDWPSLGYLVLCVAIVRRRTEVGWGKRLHSCCQESLLGLASKVSSVPNL